MLVAPGKPLIDTETLEQVDIRLGDIVSGRGSASMLSSVGSGDCVLESPAVPESPVPNGARAG